ncbi:hypothetical protein BJX76DRAFT_349737 [Aspergillus varians]
MSNRAEREAKDRFENVNDQSPRLKQSQIPVQRGEAAYDDPVQPPYSNSDQQLAQDEDEAIDQSNILGGQRLRHAKPELQGAYQEGGDEEEFHDRI